MGEQKRRRGRPPGTGYNEDHVFARAKELMDAHGVSKHRAFSMIDPNPSNVRRWERKMKAYEDACASESKSNEEFVAQVSDWALGICAKNLLNADEFAVYAILRKHGAEAVPLNAEAEVKNAQSMFNVLYEFFRDTAQASSVLAGWLNEQHKEWVHYAPRLALYAGNRLLQFEGHGVEGAPTLLERITAAYEQLLRDQLPPQAVKSLDLRQYQPKVDRLTEKRRELSRRMLDLIAEYGEIAGDDWAGDAMALEDLVHGMTSECGGVEDAAQHFLSAMTYAVQRRAEVFDTARRMRFDITIDPGDRATLRIGHSDQEIDPKYPGGRPEWQLPLESLNNPKLSAA